MPLKSLDILKIFEKLFVDFPASKLVQASSRLGPGTQLPLRLLNEHCWHDRRFPVLAAHACQRLLIRELRVIDAPLLDSLLPNRQKLHNVCDLLVGNCRDLAAGLYRLLWALLSLLSLLGLLSYFVVYRVLENVESWMRIVWQPFGPFLHLKLRGVACGFSIYRHRGVLQSIRYDMRVQSDE